MTFVNGQSTWHPPKPPLFSASSDVAKELQLSGLQRSKVIKVMNCSLVFIFISFWLFIFQFQFSFN